MEGRLSLIDYSCLHIQYYGISGTGTGYISSGGGKRVSFISRRIKTTQKQAFKSYARVFDSSEEVFQPEEITFLEKGFKRAVPSLEKKAALDKVVIELGSQIGISEPLVNKCANSIHTESIDGMNQHAKNLV